MFKHTLAPAAIFRRTWTIALVAVLLFSTGTGVADDRLGQACRQADFAVGNALSLIGPGACQADGGKPGDAEDHCYAATRELPIDARGMIRGRLVPPEDNNDVYLMHVPDPAPAAIYLSLFEPGPMAQGGFPDLRLSVWRPCDNFVAGVRAQDGSAELVLRDPEPGTYGVVVSLRYDSGWSAPSLGFEQGFFFDGVCKPSCPEEAREQTKPLVHGISEKIEGSSNPLRIPREVMLFLIQWLASAFAVQFADPVSYHLMAEPPAPA